MLRGGTWLTRVAEGSGCRIGGAPEDFSERGGDVHDALVIEVDHLLLCSAFESQSIPGLGEAYGPIVGSIQPERSA
jgi:hypothetical protein